MEGSQMIGLIGFVGARPAVSTVRGESGRLTKLSLLFAQLFYQGDWVFFFPSPGATIGLFSHQRSNEKHFRESTWF